MLQRCSIIGAAMLAATLCIQASAGAQDTKKMPEDWDGLWGRGSPVGAWDPSKPPEHANVAWAPVSKDGAATYLGFTRDRHQMCASRVYSTCDVRDAAHEAVLSRQAEQRGSSP
jgi:hypothetical protein